MLTQHFTSRLSLIRLAGIAAILAAALATALVNAAPALAAPYWCKAWRQVPGQTWYASQSNGYTPAAFTLRTPPGSTRFNGYARYNRGDVNLGGTSSQLIRGTVSSEGAGRVVINIVWRGGSSGQYIANVTGVRRTSSGNLTAGLRGTTVDTSGGGGAASWEAMGWTSGIWNVGWPVLLADVLFARERPALSRLVANDRTRGHAPLRRERPRTRGRFCDRVNAGGTGSTVTPRPRPAVRRKSRGDVRHQ